MPGYTLWARSPSEACWPWASEGNTRSELQETRWEEQAERINEESRSLWPCTGKEGGGQGAESMIVPASILNLYVAIKVY